MNIVEVKNLTKIYEKRKNKVKAVDNISFNIPEGKIVGLLGPNGSGKTTTISCLLSLLNYQQGEIKIFGEKMTPSNLKVKKDIGVVFQDVAVFNELTVYENIDYFISLYLKDKEEIRKKIASTLKLVELEKFKDFKPKELSGGLLRRLNIACGIAHEPKLIILDEPTVAVDPQSRNNILEGILKLKEKGATIIYTSHYMEEVELICDYVIILDKGKIIAEGTVEELKNSSKTEEKVKLTSDFLTPEIIREIKKLKHVLNLDYKGNTLEIYYESGKDNIVDLVNFLRKRNIEYKNIYSEKPTLNDVFLELTGKELRD